MSPRSIVWYRMIGERLVGRFGASRPVDALTAPELRAWLVELRATLSPMSVAGYVRGLRAFGNWLARDGLAAARALRGLTRPRVPRRVIEPLSDADVQPASLERITYCVLNRVAHPARAFNVPLASLLRFDLVRERLVELGICAGGFEEPRQPLADSRKRFGVNAQQTQFESIKAKALNEEGDARLVIFKPLRVEYPLDRGDVGCGLGRLLVLPGYGNPSPGQQVAQP